MSRRPREDARPAPRDPELDEDRVGLFGSWRALYVAVIVYTAALIVVLYLVTRALDHSG